MPTNADGIIKPLRRTGQVDAGHVEHWFGARCREEALTTIDVPIIGRMAIHEKIAPAMLGVFRDIQAARDDGLIDRADYGGTYNCRNTRGTVTPSPHAWGIAIDLNVHHLRKPDGSEYRSTSRMNFHCAPDEIAPSLRRLAEHFNRWGFAWGGHFNAPYLDPMHFEATELTVKKLAAPATTGPARLVVLLPGSDRHAQPLFHEGTHYLSVRDVGRMFGVDVIDRRAQDGKIYLRAPGEAGG